MMAIRDDDGDSVLWWRYMMMMVYDDDTWGWWCMMMIHDDDTWWWRCMMVTRTGFNEGYWVFSKYEAKVGQWIAQVVFRGDQVVIWILISSDESFLLDHGRRYCCRRRVECSKWIHQEIIHVNRQYTIWLHFQTFGIIWIWHRISTYCMLANVPELHDRRELKNLFSEL